MSFLNMKRVLLPPRKMWKVFTSKLQKRLHKLKNRSKAVKKSRFQSHRSSKRSTTSRLGWPSISLSIRPKKFKPKPKPKPKLPLIQGIRAPPVYVDQLFIAPIVSVSGRKEEPKPGINEIVVTSDGGEKSSNVASDQESTLGINERAEEFIARFRRQMRHQELLDRHLL